MRYGLVVLSFLLTLSLKASAESTPTRVVRNAQQPKSINPGLDTLIHVDRVPQVVKRYITNAERLSLGLPLNPPVRRKARQENLKRHQPNGGQPHRPKPSGTVSKVQSGFIQVFDASSGDLIGFVSNSFNDWGEYTTTTDLSQVLSVQIDTGAASSGLTNIATTNGPDVNFPFFGAITGFGNGDNSPFLGRGSFNYVYLGGVGETSINSIPILSSNSFSGSTGISEKIESAIWSIDSDETLHAHWVNTNSQATEIFPGITEGTLICTGDTNAFGNAFGQSQVATFKFVPTG